MFIVVMGPDGSGKSTLIANLERALQRAFHRTSCFHLMPGFFRKQGDAGPMTDPHGRPPRPLPVSLIKLVYYLMEYNLGYWFKIRPALIRSTLVLFDRYYDDLLIDPKRYRYGGPMKFARWLQRFIPRPDLFLILDVPTDHLLKRKQEVPPEEAYRQRKAYRRMAADLPNAVLLDGTLPPKEVARHAEEVILDYLHNRHMGRRSVWFPNARAEEERGYLQKALNATTDDASHTFVHFSLPDGRRYLLPIHSHTAAAKGLSLYSPQKTKSRAVKQALAIGLRVGVAQRLLSKTTLNLQGINDFLAKVFDLDALSFAISLGTPGPHRKPVIQVMTPNGEVLGYVKIGWNKETRQLVENEAKTLQYLRSRGPLPFLFPKVLFAGEWQGRYLCVQSAPPQRAKPAPTGWHPLYESALKGLASLGVKRMRLKDNPFWEYLRSRVAKIENSHHRYTAENAIEKIQTQWGDVEIPFHPAHGDFAPWNALQLDNQLYIYDWEYTLLNAPAGYDLFHFAVQRAWLMENKSSSAAFQMLKAQSAKMQQYWGLINEHASTRFLLPIFYLLARMALDEKDVQTNLKTINLLQQWIGESKA